MISGLTSQIQSDSFLFMGNEGEMGVMIQKYDWSKTDLGPIAEWPQSLLTSLSICLHSEFPILIWWGPDLRMIYNDAYKYIIGTKHPAALGQPGKECWAEIWDVIGPMLENVMTKGIANYPRDLLLLLERKEIAEECYFTFSYSPIYGEEGKISGVFTPVIETTENVIRHRRLDTIRKFSEAGSVQKDLWENIEQKIQSLNTNKKDIPFAMILPVDIADKKEYKLYTDNIPEKLINRLSYLHYNDEAESAVRKSFLNAYITCAMQEINDGEEFNEELPYGEWAIPPKKILIYPIIIPGRGKPLGIFIAAANPHRIFDVDYADFFKQLKLDIEVSAARILELEDEKRRIELLAELDKAKSLFFGNISHELRTPLTLILGECDNLLERLNGNISAFTEKLLVIRRNGQRLLQLVNALLKFSQIEAGRITIECTPVNLNRLTEEICGLFHTIIDKAGISFTVTCILPDKYYLVDRNIWETVLVNLISNAYKFTQQGEISVTLRDSGEYIELSVKDTGVGISKEDSKNLFQRFYRVKESKGRSIEGTGIGLALIKELIALMDGSILVESRENVGTVFMVRFPLQKVKILQDAVESGSSHVDFFPQLSTAYTIQEAGGWNAAPDAADKTKNREQQFSPGKFKSKNSILIVDDNKDMRDYLRGIISDEYPVREAANGMEAVELIREEIPDLVITDIMMPVMDGAALIEMLNSEPAYHSIATIIITAKAGEDSISSGLRRGADEYLVKPFNRKELIARVENLLAKKEKVRQREYDVLEKLSKTVLEGFNQPYLILSKSLEVIYLNVYAEEVLGIILKEVQGRNITELFPYLLSSDELENMKSAAEAGSSYSFTHFFQPAGKWFNVNLFSRDDITFLYAEDISEKKKSEEKYYTLFENTPAMTWEADYSGIKERLDKLKAGGIINFRQYLQEHPEEIEIFGALPKIVEINAETLQIFEAESKQEVLDNLYTLLGTESASRVFKHELILLSEGNTVFEEEVTVITLKGNKKHLLFRLVIPEDSIHTFESVLITFTDLTEWKRADEVLNQNLGAWELNLQTNEYWRTVKHDQIFGYNKLEDAWDFDRLLSHIYDEDRIQIEESFSDAVRSRTTWEAECRIVTLQNILRWIWCRGEIELDVTGVPYLVRGIIQDITEKRLTKEAFSIVEERNRLLLETSHDSIWSLDGSGVITFISEGSQNIFGYTQEEMIGRHISRFIPDYKGRQNLRLMKGILNGMVRSSVIENKFIHKNGNILSLSSNIVVTYNQNGLPQRISGASRDITETKIIETNLRQSEKQYRLLFEEHPAPMWIFNNDLMFVAVNHKARELYGYSEDEFLRLRVLDIRPEEDKELFLRYYDLMRSRVKNISWNELNSSLPDNVWRHYTKSGKLLYVLAVHNNKFIFNNQETTLVAVFDVTEKIIIEKNLRSTFNKLQTLRDSSPLGILTMDEKGIVLSWNKGAETMLGWKEAEITGKTIPAVPMESMNQFLNALKSALDGETITGFKSRFRNVQNDSLDVNIAFAPIKEDQHGSRGIIAIIEDISGENLLKQELQQSEERLRHLAFSLQKSLEMEKSRIAREIHDEFGQLLTGIKLDIYHVRKNIENSDPDIIAILKEISGQIDVLIQKIRTIASELRPGILDELGLRPAMEWQLGQFRKKTGISGNLYFSDEEINVNADISTAVFRIFQEALTNVTRHAKATIVNTTVTLDSAGMTITIEDNGIGISTEKIYALHSIGISGMRERVNMLKGTFTMYSPPGGGTGIEIWIPVEQKETLENG